MLVSTSWDSPARIHPSLAAVLESPVSAQRAELRGLERGLGTTASHGVPWRGFGQSCCLW